MRRFFLTLFLAVAAVYVLASEGLRSPVAPPAEKHAAAPAVAPAPVTPKADPVAAPQPQQVAAAPALARPIPETPVQADAVTYGAAHTTSSASANATEADFAKLSLIERKAAVQRELARLGCYDAKIDGLWGRKSQAAVRTFNARSGANLNTSPNGQLVKVLRSAPDGICKLDCQGSACTTAALKTEGLDRKNGKGGTEASYLPSWMRDARLASVDPQTLPVIGKTTPARKKTAKSRDRAKKLKTSHRVRKTVQPPYRSAHNWGPEGWPGTAR